ncbi:MAG TPA: restriction endonuclease subunit S [Amycolatopsis sp.]|nr:restriction endonuclease subunit S [Amycolatopsis sp.]
MKPYAEMTPANSPWLGEVPAHWELSRFRYEAVINGGQVDPREEPWSGMTLIAPNHIESNTGRIISVETAQEQGADSGKYLVKQGQLVYSKIRPALNKAAIAETQALCSADMYAMSFTDRVEPRFALYYFLARPFHTFATIISMRVKMPKVNREELADAPWLVPPLGEQRAIADYLDRETARIDTLVEEQQRLIEMLRERRTAVIAHATSQGTDVEFRRVITALRQGWSPNCENWPADGLKEWGVLKVGCANRGRFDPAENKRLPDEETPRSEFAVRRGELVMSRSNTKDLVGAAAVVDGDYPRLLLSDLTYGVSLTADADPAFVAYALASPGLRVQISAASKGMSHSMQKISQRDIRELRLQLPALDDQRRIAAHLDEQTAKIDALIAETERFIQLSRERRSALITAAVTGQTDVREMA